MSPTLIALFFCLVVPVALFGVGFYVGRHGTPVQVRMRVPHRDHARRDFDDFADEL